MNTFRPLDSSTSVLTAFGLAAVALFSTPALAQAPEQGRVLSVTPIVQDVVTPRTVCGTQTVVAERQTTGIGAALGGVAGGVAGNQIGGGGGRALATVAGVIGGRVLGDQLEKPNAGTTTRSVPACITQNQTLRSTVGYNVLYEYAGRRYSTQTQRPPGATIPLAVTPVGESMPDNSGGYAAAPMQPAQYISSPPVVVAPPPAAVVYPAPVAGPYYAPSSMPISIGLQYSNMRGGGHYWR